MDNHLQRLGYRWRSVAWPNCSIGGKMEFEYLPFAIIAVVLFVLPLALWLSMRTDLKFRRKLGARDPLDDSQFFALYYADTEVPENIPRRLRPIYADYFQLDHQKIRPDDVPPDIFDFDTAPLVDAIESEFDVTIPDDDAEHMDGSFASIVRFLASSPKPCDNQHNIHKYTD